MIRHLCISVTFLDPWFHGQNDTGPEWPPSPMRLFEALLAGARAGSCNRAWSPATADAFRWLESRPAPIVVAPVARRAAAFTLFVPSNDGDRTPDRQRRLSGKTLRPHRLLDGDTVHFLWRIEELEWRAAEQHVNVLCRQARRLLALGWGIDQVVGEGRVLLEAEVDALSGRRWLPSEGTHRPGASTWRVPTSGSLADLEQVYKSFANRLEGKRFRPPLPLRRFERVHYLSALGLPLRPYAAFELPEGVAFRQEDVVRVAAMLRSLAIDHGLKDTHPFPGGVETYVAGHVGATRETPPRFSYLPLPAIGHPHADGMIRRLLVAEPFGGDCTHARWAERRLRRGMLRDRDGNERGLLLDPWRSASRSVIRRYVESAKVWQSVTPVILPGFDDGKHSKAQKVLVAALNHAGIPVELVDDAVLQKAPFWPGSQHPRCYFSPSYLAGLPGWHARLLFREPVPGPIAVGAGRHLGLGLFAAATG